MTRLGEGTFGEVQTEVFRLVRESATGNPGRLLKVKSAINRAYERMVKSRQWPGLERAAEIGLRKFSDTDVTTLESGEALAPLPWGCRDVQSIILSSPNYSELEYVNPTVLFRKAADVKDSEGIPERWTVVGETVQWKPLATNQTVKVVASDTGNDDISSVRITFTEADGYTGETVSEKLTGTFSTGVATSVSVLAGWSIHRIRADENWKGELKVQQTSDDADIVNLRAPYQPEAGNTVERHDARLLIRVHPVPNADYKGTVIWRHIPRKLVNASDMLEIPAFSAIAYAAAADLMKVDQEFLKARELARDADTAMTDSLAGETQKGSVSRPRMGNVMRATGFRPWGRYWSKW